MTFTLTFQLDSHWQIWCTLQILKDFIFITLRLETISVCCNLWRTHHITNCLKIKLESGNRGSLILMKFCTISTRSRGNGFISSLSLDEVLFQKNKPDSREWMMTSGENYLRWIIYALLFWKMSDCSYCILHKRSLGTNGLNPNIYYFEPPPIPNLWMRNLLHFPNLNCTSLFTIHNNLSYYVSYFE